MSPNLRSRQVILTSALVILGVIISLLVTPNSHSATVLSVMVSLFIVSVSVMRIPGLHATHPALSRSALTVAAMVATITATYFFSATTNFDLATGASMSIVLLGLSFLTGASGQISLGNGAFMGVGAFAMAVWANHHATTPIVVSLLIAVVCGALVGLLLGLPATRLRGPYLAGMTLAFAVAFSSILSSFSSWTGGDSGLQLPTSATPPHWLTSLFHSGTSLLTTNTMWLADITILATGVAFFFMGNLFASRTGRAMRLIRDNDVAAELAGVSLPRARVIAFVVSSSYAALGGALWTLVNNSVSPSTYSFALSITVLSLVVIGGIGTIPGALIGGLIYAYSSSVISWITNQTGLNPQGNVASQLNGVIFGVLLIATMLFAPMGISGAVLHAWRKRRAHARG